MSKPKITFIICTYNRAEYLDDTIQSVIQTDLYDATIELLVIDNNSQDETEAIVQKYKKSNDDILIRYVKEQKQGLSHARNRGIKEAAAPNVVFLDDDIRATEKLIPAWISFFENHPAAAAAGGKIHVQFDDPRPDWMSHFLLPLLGYHDLGNSIKKYPKNKYPFGGNMGFKKKLFDEIGLFDAELGRKEKALGAGEEKDLFNRIYAQDREIFYLPDAFLYHRVNGKRLTVDYIHKQALGLGASMKRRLENVAMQQQVVNWLSEIGKLLASFPLGLFYLLKLQPSKAKMLFKFRWWIWRGYFTSPNH